MSAEIVDALKGTVTGPQGGAPRGFSRWAFLVAAVAAAVAGGTGRVLAGSAGVTAAPVMLLAGALVTTLVAGVSFIAEPRSWTPPGAGRYVGRHRPGNGPLVNC